ncbi:fusion protein [Jeilongvirus chaetodipodis]|uniref:Fusion protein n=1 Tax=Paramyxoviridae sp. TaxID=1663356 RepID=A0AC61TNV6_9MONO|nr:fusion protein [Paramyxoviridae sp.]
MLAIKLIHLVSFLLPMLEPLYCQVAFSELSKIGIIKSRNYGLKITSAYSTQVMVLKLIPNSGNLTECTKPALDNYKITLNRLLTPIKQALDFTKSTIQDKQLRNVRYFFGAVIGGVALGIATSAQITAGVALHNSIENARAINNMKDAILLTNQAVEELHSSQLQTVLVINALQNKINSQLVPMLNVLSCQLAKNTLELYLNRYLSEISLIFGPNLRDPGFATLSVQAIASAFNGDFDTLSRNLGYSGKDFLDLMESNSINGRIIDISLENYYIVIQMEYPILTTITDAIIQEFNLISYNSQGLEWISIFPTSILLRGGYISNIDLSTCVRTQNNYICRQDTSIPMSDSLYKCVRGNVTMCARTRVVSSHVPKFALSDGVIFANCIATICKCQNPVYMIVQEQISTNTMISAEKCSEILIDNVFITVGRSSFARSMFASNVSIGEIVSADPVDIGNEMAVIKASLNKTKDLLSKSNSILNRINRKGATTAAFTITMCISCASLIWCMILTVAFIRFKFRSITNPHSRLLMNSNRNMGSLNTITP